MDRKLLDHLQENLLLGDGAMGTMLYARGIPHSHCFDELNMTRPALVQEILREYVAAGAQAIETNTFTANRHKLDRYDFGDQVEEINVRGVEIARAAAGDKAYVLASVGPVLSGEVDELSESEIATILSEQVAALASAAPHALILETFARAFELEIALRTARAACDLPIVAQISADEEGYTRDGQHIVAVFQRLRQAGADVVGVNCAKGPMGILHALEQVPLEEGLLLSAYPNAGLPAYVDGRYMYLSTPEYFADSALRLRDQGVRLIGGCCGTTPEHTRAMAAAIAGLKPVKSKRIVHHAVRLTPSPPRRKRQAAILRSVRQRPTFIVELDPPRDLQYEKIITGAKALKACGVDAITMADSSLGVTRMSNMALGHLVQESTGLLPVIHLSCRDRNLIGIQAELMGLHALGINHVLALTGDPAKFGDQPGATSVYDLNSFNLVRMIKQMNRGIAFSGQAMGQATDFVIGVAFNPNVARIETQVKRLRKKVALGADFVMTQPIYRPGQAKALAERAKEFEQPFFVGVMPLVSSRNADFLHHEVPGIEIPDSVRQRMRRYEGERAREEGVRIAAEILQEVLTYFNGVYLITPFVRYEMCVQLVEHAKPAQRLVS